MGRPCIIENCENVVADNSRLDACSLCRASINRWKRRSPAEIYHRRQQLTKFNARMEPLVDDEVIQLKSKRKRSEYADRDLVRITTSLVRTKPKDKTTERRTQA